VFGTNADGRFETLRNELLRDPDVVNATISTNAPFNGSWGREINWEGAAVDEKINIRYNPVGYSFIPTYEMKMKLGRNFSEEHSTDSEACIINETAWRAFGWDDPLGKRLDDNRFTVIGVVEDFHPYSVHEKIPAYYMTLHSGELKDGGIYTVSIEPRNRDAGVEFIDRQFRTFFPDAIVEVTNFDKELDLGTKDVWEIVEKVFFAFSIIAILIAANGLFGLVSFAAQRRLKEIGVRRVFGADSAGLYWMMSKEFLVLLLFAIALAAPAGYLVAQSTPGAYKYNLQFIDYFFSIGLMFLTALAATIYHTTRAVLSNPVETLRCE
jgi:putative ABC transport system permease protein